MYQFENYTAMRQKIGERYQQEDLNSAADILTWALSEYPDHLAANVFNLAFIRASLNQPEEAIAALAYGLERKVWFGEFEMGLDAWQVVRETEAFQTILSSFAELRQIAQDAAKPELTVITPENYNPAKKYPLFIALHGGGETVAAFQPHWISPQLAQEFIVAYPQSSRVISMTGFSWMGQPSDRQELITAYEQILAEYNIDPWRVVMGGFSAGGHQTISLLLDEDLPIPIKGFVVLCPPVPASYSDEALARIAQRGQRGCLLTTEMDERLPAQRNLAIDLKTAGVPLQFEISPNIGHWYPEDFGQKIDAGLDFIFEK